MVDVLYVDRGMGVGGWGGGVGVWRTFQEHTPMSAIFKTVLDYLSGALVPSGFDSWKKKKL